MKFKNLFDDLISVKPLNAPLGIFYIDVNKAFKDRMHKLKVILEIEDPDYEEPKQ